METYKEYKIIVRRAGIRGGWEASAYKGLQIEPYDTTGVTDKVFSPRMFGKGAKAKARAFVVSRIDEKG